MMIAESTVEQAVRVLKRMEEEVSRVMIGQQPVVHQVLVALLAGGHVLIEGVPGLGKTLLVRALAKTFNGQFARIQFTPDLMPSDVMGHAMYDMKNQQFVVRRGPVFTHLLLADEINRAPAKTQSALLEVMQEQQVTIEGQPHALPPPFMTLATQNPVEQEGTYPLPEAQLDRFLLKISIDYPAEQDEIALVQSVTQGKVGGGLDVDAVNTIVTPEVIMELQRLVAHLRVDPEVTAYAVRLTRATRDWPGLSSGAGPRGAIALLRAARAQALLSGRGFVTPEDIKAVAPAALRHRVRLTPDMEIEGLSADDVLKRLLNDIPAPRA